jgi:hypothetical protein
MEIIQQPIVPIFSSKLMLVSEVGFGTVQYMLPEIHLNSCWIKRLKSLSSIALIQHTDECSHVHTFPTELLVNSLQLDV